MLKDIEIQGQTGGIIKYSFFPAKRKAKANLIVCHGFAEFKDWGFIPYLGEKFSDELNVITFNFSHNGIENNLLKITNLEKFSMNTYTLEIKDLEKIVDLIHKGHIAAKDLDNQLTYNNLPIYILGHSRGAAVGLIYTFDNPKNIKGVISWNGLTFVDTFHETSKLEMETNGKTYVRNPRTNEYFPIKKDILEDIKNNNQRFNIFERAKFNSTPIILVQGSNDNPILIEKSKQLLKERTDIKYVEIKDGDHVFNSSHPFNGESLQISQAIKATKLFIDELNQK